MFYKACAKKRCRNRGDAEKDDDTRFTNQQENIMKIIMTLVLAFLISSCSPYWRDGDHRRHDRDYQHQKDDKYYKDGKYKGGKKNYDKKYKDKDDRKYDYDDKYKYK